MDDQSLALAITKEEAEEFTRLAKSSYKTLREVRDEFETMLIEMLEHPFRELLPNQLQDVLSYLAGLPDVDVERLPDGATDIVKGWVLNNALMLGLINNHYTSMSKQA